MSDALERLRAANPIGLEDVAPEALAPELRHRRRRPRRPLRYAVALTVVAVAVAVALPLVGLPDRERAPLGPGMAVAAARVLDPGDSILHVTLKTEQRSPTRARSQTEIWIAPRGGAGRIVTIDARGRTVDDYATRPGELDPVSAARDMLERGALRPAGHATFDGRRVARFRTARGDRTWYFDVRTYTPLALDIHPAGTEVRARTRVLRFERLQLTERNRRLLRPHQ